MTFPPGTVEKSPSIRPIGVDLFAGAGGLSLGFEQAGFDVAAAVEIDPIHCATHEYNFPYSKAICASVVDLSGDEIRHRAGIGTRDIDVLFGGAPCQGFSMIGKRALDDPRNQLVFHYVRLIRELKPSFFVFENVRGLTLGAHAKFLNELIQALEESGYSLRLPYRVLNAADFGVPQDRRRLFLIGARKGLPVPSYPEPRLLQTRATVWQAIGDLPDPDSFPALLESDEAAVSWNTNERYGQLLRGLTPDTGDFSYQRRFDRQRLTSSLRTEHTTLSKQRFLATAHGKTEPVSRFRKLDPQGLCNTLRAGTDSARGAFTSPRPIHPFLPRVISVREAARLHSYPDWFRLHSTKWHGFRQVGNSVPPWLGRAVAEQVMAAMSLSASKPTEILQPGSTELLRLDMGAAARHFQVARNVIAQRARKDRGTQIKEDEIHAH